jgi:hypothetical protein
MKPRAPQAHRVDFSQRLYLARLQRGEPSMTAGERQLHKCRLPASRSRPPCLPVRRGHEVPPTQPPDPDGARDAKPPVARRGYQRLAALLIRVTLLRTYSLRHGRPQLKRQCLDPIQLPILLQSLHAQGRGGTLCFSTNPLMPTMPDPTPGYEVMLLPILCSPHDERVTFCAIQACPHIFRS